jgi:predicted transcriptional regulator
MRDYGESDGDLISQNQPDECALTILALGLCCVLLCTYPVIFIPPQSGQPLSSVEEDDGSGNAATDDDANPEFVMTNSPHWMGFMMFGLLVTHEVDLEVWNQHTEEPMKTRGRRSRLDLYAAIVKALISDGITANALIIHLNLNSRLAKKYLAGLLQEGLIEVQREGRFATYSATQEGREWFELYWRAVKGVTHVT